MKSKNVIFPLVCAALLMTGCKPIDTSIHLTKVELGYAENGQLIKINADQLYDLAITKQQNLVCFYSVDMCAMCNTLKEQMVAFSKKQHCMIYYIDMTNITQKDYETLYDITGYINDAYQFEPWKDGINIELPRLDVYSHQGIVMPISDHFVDNLLKYTTVTSAS